MIERRGRAGFALEAFQRLAVLGKMLRQKLQGDEAAELGVLGLYTTPMPPPPSFSRMR